MQKHGCKTKINLLNIGEKVDALVLIYIKCNFFDQTFKGIKSVVNFNFVYSGYGNENYVEGTKKKKNI